MKIEADSLDIWENDKILAVLKPAISKKYPRSPFKELIHSYKSGIEFKHLAKELLESVINEPHPFNVIDNSDTALILTDEYLFQIGKVFITYDYSNTITVYNGIKRNELNLSGPTGRGTRTIAPKHRGVVFGAITFMVQLSIVIYLSTILVDPNVYILLLSIVGYYVLAYQLWRVIANLIGESVITFETENKRYDINCSLSVKYYDKKELAEFLKQFDKVRDNLSAIRFKPIKN